ncbi:hypothetical protein CBR_g45919 [Chara braunii]|uniref:Uncharacterized protein n=1 Tax=Chara braunii TaxID=69332 RepID=A0A388LZL0_CHABU|nr:hypothetical protein CBR_g45919 [Chara braunii]|eukprot:GBG87764.1 hypothetical protein CBR_g45919 [Chara braunii]
MAKLFAEQYAAMEKKKDEEAGLKRDPTKGKDKASYEDKKGEEKLKARDGSLRICEGEVKKRGQEVLQGSSPLQPDAGRQKTLSDATIGPLDAGLLLVNFNMLKRDKDSFQRNQESILQRMVSAIEKLAHSRQEDGLAGGTNDTPSSSRPTRRLAEVFASVAGHSRRVSGSLSAVRSSSLGFDRVRDGKKAVVASTGKEGRKQYLADMKNELMEYKADLEVLCRKDNIKYINKKQAVHELAILRTCDAYGDTEEDDDEELLNGTGFDQQEENPS